MKEKTKEEEYEELLEDYARARSYYNDMHIRADWVNWSKEAEKEAWNDYRNLKRKIIEIMLREEDDEQNADN